MGDINLKYSAATSMTVTLASLAADALRQSTVVDNTTNLYIDALVGGSVQVGTSPTAGSVINVFAYGAHDTSDYTAGASGSDAAYTAGDKKLLPLVGQIIIDGDSNADYEFGPFSVAAAFGGILPSKWGLVFENLTDVALNATGTNNKVKYFGVEANAA